MKRRAPENTDQRPHAQHTQQCSLPNAEELPRADQSDQSRQRDQCAICRKLRPRIGYLKFLLHRKAYDQGITFFALAICVGLAASALISLISPILIRVSNLSPETTTIARQLFHSVNITVIFASTQSVLTKGILRGGGDSRFLMLADILFLWAVSVPLGYFTGIVWDYSAFWVYLALHADWLIKTVWCAIRLFHGNWIHEATKTLLMHGPPEHVQNRQRSLSCVDGFSLWHLFLPGSPTFSLPPKPCCSSALFVPQFLCTDPVLAP